MDDRYKTAFFQAISTTKDDELRKYMLEMATEVEDKRITYESLQKLWSLYHVHANSKLESYSGKSKQVKVAKKTEDVKKNLCQKCRRPRHITEECKEGEKCPLCPRSVKWHPEDSCCSKTPDLALQNIKDAKALKATTVARTRRDHITSQMIDQ